MNVISLTGFLLVGGTLPGLPGLPSAPRRFGPRTFANLFGFDDRKSTNTRLGPANHSTARCWSHTHGCPWWYRQYAYWNDLSCPWLTPRCWKQLLLQHHDIQTPSWLCKARAEWYYSLRWSITTCHIPTIRMVYINHITVIYFSMIITIILNSYYKDIPLIRIIYSIHITSIYL